MKYENRFAIKFVFLIIFSLAQIILIGQGKFLQLGIKGGNTRIVHSDDIFGPNLYQGNNGFLSLETYWKFKHFLNYVQYENWGSSLQNNNQIYSDLSTNFSSFQYELLYPIRKDSEFLLLGIGLSRRNHYINDYFESINSLEIVGKFSPKISKYVFVQIKAKTPIYNSLTYSDLTIITDHKTLVWSDLKIFESDFTVNFKLSSKIVLNTGFNFYYMQFHTRFPEIKRTFEQFYVGINYRFTKKIK